MAMASSMARRSGTLSRKDLPPTFWTNEGLVPVFFNHVITVKWVEVKVHLEEEGLGMTGREKRKSCDRNRKWLEIGRSRGLRWETADQLEKRDRELIQDGGYRSRDFGWETADQKWIAGSQIKEDTFFTIQWIFDDRFFMLYRSHRLFFFFRVAASNPFLTP